MCEPIFSPQFFFLSHFLARVCGEIVRSIDGSLFSLFLFSARACSFAFPFFSHAAHEKSFSRTLSSMATTDECCAVCAEPLKFVAIAHCGHAESCAKCALRLRAVLDDSRCVICQQPGDCVYVTRSAGELTNAPRPEAFDGFKVRRLFILLLSSSFFKASSLNLHHHHHHHFSGPSQRRQALVSLESAGLLR